MTINHSRYEIEKELGQGAMACVYLARDVKLGRQVALKAMHPHLLSKGHVKKRFLMEAGAVAALSHENIVSLYDVEEDSEGVPFLVMEYVEGQTLDAMLEKHHSLPNLAVLELAIQLLRGLAFAHEKGIIHRDIKPSNLLVDRRGCLKITDFGVAHVFRQEAFTQTGEFLGTPKYVSPEIIKGEGPGPQSDVFSAACVLYECLSGQSPFAGDNAHETLSRICQDEPADLSEICPRAIPFLSGWLVKGLSKEPQERGGAATNVHSIEEYCLQNRFKMGVWRLEQLSGSPQIYKSREGVELHKYFVTQAGEARARGEMGKYHRLSHLAGLFDESDTYQPRRKKPKSKPKTQYSYFIIFAGIILLLGLAYFQKSLLQWSEVSTPEGHTNLSADTNSHLSAMGDSLSRGPQAGGNSGGKETRDRTVKKITDFAAPAEISSNPGNQQKRDIVHIITRNLRIKSRPPYSRIILNGLEIGQTPFEGQTLLKTSLNTIKVVKQGCETQEITFRGDSSDSLHFAVNLIPLR